MKSVLLSIKPKYCQLIINGVTFTNESKEQQGE